LSRGIDKEPRQTGKTQAQEKNQGTRENRRQAEPPRAKKTAL